MLPVVGRVSNELEAGVVAHAVVSVQQSGQQVDSPAGLVWLDWTGTAATLDVCRPPLASERATGTCSSLPPQAEDVCVSYSYTCKHSQVSIRTLSSIVPARGRLLPNRTGSSAIIYSTSTCTCTFYSLRSAWREMEASPLLTCSFRASSIRPTCLPASCTMTFNVTTFHFGFRDHIDCSCRACTRQGH